MRRYSWVLAVLIIGLMTTLFTVGCGKKQSGATTGGVTGSAPVAEVAKSSDPLDQLRATRSTLSSYEMSMTVAGRKMIQVVKLDKGKLIRTKADGGTQGWMLTQLDKNVRYVYNPATKTAMRMTLAVTKDQMPDSSGLPPNARSAKSPKLTSAKLDGKDCWISLSTVAGAGTAKAWIDKEYGLPRKVQMGKQSVSFSYDKINSVPDSEFELPAGTKVQEMPAMPQGARMPSGQ